VKKKKLELGGSLGNVPQKIKRIFVERCLVSLLISLKPYKLKRIFIESQMTLVYYIKLYNLFLTVDAFVFPLKINKNN
jgi:hypothetical protein